jgi:hypothetical protein
LRLNRIETVLAPELTKLLDLQPPVRAEVFHRKQSEPDTPETVAEKAKQARDVMTKAADALGG